MTILALHVLEAISGVGAFFSSVPFFFSLSISLGVFHLFISFSGFITVSIGRRLLDPLAEFVKIDPKHVGVGQYQVGRTPVRALPCENMSLGICRQQRPRSDCTDVQSDQVLCSPITKLFDTIECISGEQMPG